MRHLLTLIMAQNNELAMLFASIDKAKREDAERERRRLEEERKQKQKKKEEPDTDDMDDLDEDFSAVGQVNATTQPDPTPMEEPLAQEPVPARKEEQPEPEPEPEKEAEPVKRNIHIHIPMHPFAATGQQHSVQEKEKEVVPEEPRQPQQIATKATAAPGRVTIKNVIPIKSENRSLYKSAATDVQAFCVNLFLYSAFDADTRSGSYAFVIDTGNDPVNGRLILHASSGNTDERYEFLFAGASDALRTAVSASVKELTIYVSDAQCCRVLQENATTFTQGYRTSIESYIKAVKTVQEQMAIRFVNTPTGSVYEDMVKSVAVSALHSYNC